MRRSECAAYRFFVIVSLLCVHSLLTSATRQQQQEQQQQHRQRQYNSTQYNVVLVIFDDLRPVIGGYGDSLAKTPYLNAFINESFVFTRAYSQQALCAPSRNSLLTSRRIDTLHLYDFYSYWRTFSGNFTTIPQYFKEHGYYTYGAGKIFHPGISSNNSDDYPLSWSVPPFRPKTEKFMNSPVCPDENGVLRKNLICPVHLQTQPFKTLPDIESASDAIRFVQSRDMTMTTATATATATTMTMNHNPNHHQDHNQHQHQHGFQHEHQHHPQKPYFLALGFHKPHINFRFPFQFLDKFYLHDFYNYTEDTIKPHDMPNVAWNPYTDVRSRDDFKYMNISFPYGPISPMQSAQIRQAYYASVAYVDDLFGKFMANINRERTIVVVTSDHGWSLGEHAEWAKYSNFEVALRVPLIIRSPEFQLQKPKYMHSITELLDIFPTLVDLAHLPKLPSCQKENNFMGIRQKSCTEGKSLYPQMNGIGLAKSYIALSQYPRPGIQPTKHPNSDKPKLKNIKVMGYSLRTDHFRYTLWARFYAQNFTRDWSNIYGEELYDHRLDAGEEINLITLSEYDEIRLKLRQTLINALD